MAFLRSHSIMYLNSEKRETTFTVNFTARVRDSYTFDLARKQFMATFNVDEEKMQALIERIGSQGSYPILKNAPYDTAKALAEKVYDCGFVCSPDADEISMDMGATIYEQIEAQERYKTPKDIEHWMVCPECFKRQDADNDACEDCNTIFHR